MFFEGSEKKVEVIASSGTVAFRTRGREFWESIVNKSGAKILSEISSSYCDSYLLSESSLFVWDDRFTMITCGQTTLVRAVQEFLSQGSPEDVGCLIYERKNEYFPQLQKTDFLQDAQTLNHLLGGQAWQFGNTDEHHLMVYQYSKNFKPTTDDFTLEILMYDIQGSAKELFNCKTTTLSEIHERTQIHRIFDNFEIDDHVFSPCGYSLNGLRGSDYYTIHVTPQDIGTYVSFETNVNVVGNIEPTVRKVLEVFQPRRFDVVVFSPSALEKPVQISNFVVKNHTQSNLNCGYHISFSHHYQSFQRPALPQEIQL